MTMQDMSCAEFVHALGSDSSTPGGGGAAAMMGALGVALGDMVSCFTIGRKKYADVEEGMKKLQLCARELENKLLQLMEEDAIAFAPLSKAYGLPSGTDEEKAYKAKVMEKCLRDAAQVPLKIMELSGEGLILLREFAEKGSAMMVSDAGCGAVCCRAALEAGALNVRINTRSMKDREYAENINAKADKMLADYTLMAEQIFADVMEKCR